MDLNSSEMELHPHSDRDQIFMTSLNMLVEQDSMVRVIDVFLEYVDTLDLPFISHSSHTGRPAFSNQLMIGIYIYGYLNRVRSSRQLEKACKTNVELFWLNKNLKPCYKTIANFRKDNGLGFRKLFVAFRDFCKQLNLYGKSVIAIDGSKFRGQNSMKNNYNIRKINKHLDHIESKHKEYLDSLQTNDVDEERISKLNERRAKYQNLKDELAKTEDTQISTSDPDTRALPLRMKIVQVGYNLQSVVDDKNNLIVDYEVTNKSDHRALAPMALKAKQALGLDPDDSLSVLADKGYHTGEQMQQCHDNNIETIIAIPRRAKHTDTSKPAHLRKDNFTYEASKDVYTCPEGKQLTKQARYQKKDKKGNHSTLLDRYTIKFSNCENCQFLEQCVSKANRKRNRGRYIDRYLTDGAVVKNKKTVQTNKELYKRRQAIVEHPFGTIKRQWGFAYTLMKTIPKVQTEFSIIMLCYNLRRTTSILGANTLKLALKELNRCLFCFKSLMTPVKTRKLLPLHQQPTNLSS